MNTSTEYRLAYVVLGLLVVIDVLIGGRIVSRVIERQGEIQRDAPIFLLSLLALQLLLLSLFGRLRQTLHAYEKLRQNNEAELEFVHQLLDAATEGMLVYDGETRIAYLTARAAEILGHDRDELLGRNAFGIVLPEDIPILQAQWQHNGGGQELSEPYHVRVLDAHGQLRPIRLSARPRWHRGRIVGAFAIITPDPEPRRADAVPTALRT